MFCNECGAEINEGTDWCPGCGAPVPTGQVEGGYHAPGDASPVGMPGQAPPGQLYEVPEDQPYHAPGDASQLYQERYETEQWGYQPGAGAPPRSSTKRADKAKVFSILTAVGGLLVFISTFLPWISFFGLGSGSGWQAMLHGSGGGFSLFISGSGVLLFTGFWSIVLGLAIIGGAVLVLMERPGGGRVSQIAGGVAAVMALISMFTFWTHNLSPGIGLWTFLLFGIASAILGELALRSYGMV